MTSPEMPEAPKTDSELKRSRLKSIAQLKFAQMLPQPTRSRSLSMLPTDDQLPGSWVLDKDQTYPIGVVKGRSKPELVRARELKSICARRFFKRDPDQESLTFTVAPYASSEDARKMIDNFEISMHDLYNKIVNLNYFRVAEPDPPDSLGHTQCIECEWEAFGHPRTARGLAAQVDDVCFQVQYLRDHDPVSWPQLFEMAELFSEHVRTVISGQ